ncbi:MAG TPA: HAD family phosphatase [Aquabacterium sp.]|nr:HAD family phosphatase [Aquabacterium sp.]
MSKKIKAVIFDMDGVLIDAKEWHYEALNQALRLFGMEISRYDHLVTFDGLPTKKKLEMLSMERGLPRELHGLLNDLKQQFTMQMVHTLCKPKFVHQYALSKLKAAGLKVAVCSNSIHDTVDVIMRKADLMRHLDFFLSNQDVKNGKPDPEIYNKAIAMLGLVPQECLIVEDNPNGILAAQRSGAHVMQVADTDEVNLDNLLSHIAKAETAMAARQIVEA